MMPISNPTDQFEVELTSQAEKELTGLRPWVAQAKGAILQLETDPLRGHPLSGSLRGCRSLEFSLRGSGVFRAIYLLLEEERVCLVFIIGPHENIYTRAERRVETLRRTGRS